MKEFFLSDTIPDHVRYSELFKYFIAGFLYYMELDGAHVYYPGVPSKHGAKIDSMEGFCRVLPMISAWIYSGRPTVIYCEELQKSVDLIKTIKAGLVAGTDAGSNAFWGHICDRDQRIVEAADVALSIWLLRNSVWMQLSSCEKQRIEDWLLEVNRCRVYDNNWHVFPIIINEVLCSLGCRGEKPVSLEHYNRLKCFYVGNGWFSDGKNGNFDYYNAWGIHYALHWLTLINPKFDPVFIDESLYHFINNFKYFFSPEGIPITGRSICYRMAVPAPLVAAAVRKVGNITPGMARRALDCVWRYFIGKDAVCCGKVTQGYWQDDTRLLDNYSGPASCLWSLRSLVMALYSPPETDFWQAPQEKLPVEQNDYEILIPEIGWKIKGEIKSGNVRIIKTTPCRNASRRMKQETILRKVAGKVFGRPFRPNNTYFKYCLVEYNSSCPFFCNDEV
jgi:hypothetical protein